MVTWILLLLILSVLLALFLAAWLSARRARQPYVRRYFWCPLKQLYVQVTFLADPAHRDRYYDVLTCSAFEDPSQVNCDRQCMDLPEAKVAPSLYDMAGHSTSL